MVLPPSKESADSAPDAGGGERALRRRCGIGGGGIADCDHRRGRTRRRRDGLRARAYRGEQIVRTSRGASCRAMGPGARQLRRLAATLPIAGAPRLERIRRLAGSRAASLNVRCFRIAAADGAAFLILTADDADMRGAGARRGGNTQSRPARRRSGAGRWRPIGAGAFSGAWTGTDASALRDPALAAALGAAAPRAGETIETRTPSRRH